MKVTQISIGRFHHFHLARQLEKHGLLEAIYTGYPKFKLKDEPGIPQSKIKTYPWIHTPLMMARVRLGLENLHYINSMGAWLATETLDRYVASKIKEKTILVGLSGSGLRAGTKTQKLGGRYICDRGSSHIRFQNEILKEEYALWKLPYHEIHPKMIEKEEREYEKADRITVPSEFVRNSFLLKGVEAKKISKVMYGARLERFSKQGSPDHDKFVVLWVGGVSVRKGFMYLLNAFRQLRHPRKELKVVGIVSSELSSLIKGDLTNVNFIGLIANERLPELYSTANVFVLPSLEEGLAMVQGEALACGCPIISSTNSGAEDLITHGKEGFIIPIRSSDAILNYLQEMADSPHLRDKMSEEALKRVKQLGGWDTYGDNYSELVRSLY